MNYDTGGLVRITAEWRGVAVDTSDGYTGPATIVTPVIEIDDDTPVGEIASWAVWAVWSYAPWERGIDCVGIDDTTAPDARDIVVEETTEPAALTSSDLMRSCDLGETAAACGEEHGFIWSSIAAADIVFLTLEEARAALDTSDDRPVDEIGYWYDSSAGYVRGVSVVDEIDEVLAGIAAGDRRESALFEMPGRWIAEDSGRRLRGAAHAIDFRSSHPGYVEWEEEMS